MKTHFNIKTLKNIKEVSYHEISIKTGIRYQTLLLIRDNKIKTIKIKYINALLKYFNCNIEDLIKIK